MCQPACVCVRVCVCLMGLCAAKLRSEFPGGRVCHRLSGYDSRVAPPGRSYLSSRQGFMEDCRHTAASCSHQPLYQVRFASLVYNCWLFGFLLPPTNSPTELPILTPDADNPTQQLVGPYSVNPGDGDAGCGLGKIPVDQQQCVRLSDQQQPRSKSLKPLLSSIHSDPPCGLHQVFITKPQWLNALSCCNPTAVVQQLWQTRRQTFLLHK